MRDVQRILDALTSPVRREILTLIWDRELPAGEIAAAFHVTAPTVSQHLTVLREAGLVTMTAEGNFRRYRARQDVLRSLHGALGGNPSRWTPADDIPETELATAETRPFVIAHVDVETDQATTFTAVTDPDIYSRWMGVPVQIDDGRFSCTMEWGTRIEGVYEIVVEPSLIALRWDFDDDENVPIPGGGMVGYMRFAPIAGGCHVEVHQLVESPEQAVFMESAWTMVLGRLKTGVVAASDKSVPTPRRGRRPKTRASRARA
jgi:DNA-binding transcriptional ArsR family regulator